MPITLQALFAPSSLALKFAIKTLLGGGSDPVITKEPSGAFTTEITDAALK